MRSGGPECACNACGTATPVWSRPARTATASSSSVARAACSSPATDAGSSISTPAGLTFSDQQLEAWRTVLEDRTRRLADRGCGYLMLVVPDAHSVYPEDLPRKLRLVDERPVHRLLAHLSQSGSPARVVLYPLDELLERKREQEIFPRTDEHWNEAAAFAAYETVAAMLSEETPMRVLHGGRGGDLEADGVRKPRLQATMAAPVAACPRLRAALGCSAGHGQRDRGDGEHDRERMRDGAANELPDLRRLHHAWSAGLPGRELRSRGLRARSRPSTGPWSSANGPPSC